MFSLKETSNNNNNNIININSFDKLMNINTMSRSPQAGSTKNR